MKRAMFWVAAESVVLAVSFIAVVMWYPFEDSTLWAPAYNELAFRSLMHGDTKNEVLAKLGPALRAQGLDPTRPATRSEGGRWSYTLPGRSDSSGFYVRAIVFDSTWHLARKDEYFSGD